ncbi:MAG: hypothetical protein H0V24_08070 [Chloroflexia bacterium]|nr:hypothetical protein [Chloroflexia bacterium]
MSRTLTVLSVVIVVLAAIMDGQPSPLSAAQADDSSYADHPLTGVWLVNTGMDFTPTTFNADGSATFGYASNYVDPVVGLTFQGPGLAAWEPVDEQTGRFSMFQALSDADGTYVGSFTLEASATVSEDDKTFTAVGEDFGHIVIRDAVGNVLLDDMIPINVFATRIMPGEIDFPFATPTAATPAA